MSQRTAVVFGATGVAGRALCERLLDQGDAIVVGVSRRVPKDLAGRLGFRHLAVNLLDAPAAVAALQELGAVDEAYFCAYLERADADEAVRVNLALLDTALAGMAAAGGPEVLVLLEGTKYYGCHLGPFKTPAKEDDPRLDAPIFYYTLQDRVEEASAADGWRWSAVRPHSICGFTTGSPMNLMTVLGVYGAVCRATGAPFDYPGSKRAFETLFQVTDAVALGDAMIWAARTPESHGRAFNITNGDLFRWQTLWPRLAEFFDVAPGAPDGAPLSRRMAAKGPLWDELVRRHDLAPNCFEEIAAWNYGDYVFSIDYDIISDTTRARRAGFDPAIDSEARILETLADFRANRIIP